MHVCVQRLHITVVGNALLPSPEVHLALATHLEKIRSDIDAPLIAAVLGIALESAHHIAPSLLQTTGGTRIQCFSMIKGKRKRDPPRRCSKKAKVASPADVKGLCCYHIVASV